ncbi:MAG: endonuclease/exonuclease/phosphatase family protein [Saprospiraceae bacterium]|nr:endonuclease/exonuclease/phosphatase family protein [Saprospiraceae bacterium]MBP6566373.1 endonuclease/exonuclease/phosphatase family protein [Saprospiraceae bacterium]
MKRVAGIGNKIVAAMILLITVTAIFIPSIDFTEKLQDYLVHILFFLLVSGLIGLIISNKIILFTSFGCAAALALFLKNASNTELKNPKAHHQDKLTVVHINLSSITDVETVIKNINESSVDLISFQEYTPDWANIIPKIAGEKFPFNHEEVRIDIYGKAVFSKYPIRNLKIIEFADIPNIAIEIVKNNLNFKIFSTYMTPALEKQSKSIAKNQFEKLEKFIKSETGGLIVLGEFNQVYWSHDIISFRNRTGLLNSRKNVDISTLKMPYDHIFYAPYFECSRFEELNDSLANHIGCKASFQVKTNKIRENKY